MTGASTTIVVRIFGPDLDVLQRKAAEVGKAKGGVNGASDVKIQALTLVPRVEVSFRPERAQQIGVSSATVRDTVATMLRGTKVGEAPPVSRAAKPRNRVHQSRGVGHARSGKRSVTVATCAITSVCCGCQPQQGHWANGRLPARVTPSSNPLE